MKYGPLTEVELAFIRDNYERLGPTKCAHELDRDPIRLCQAARKMGKSFRKPKAERPPKPAPAPKPVKVVAPKPDAPERAYGEILQPFTLPRGVDRPWPSIIHCKGLA